MGSAFLKSLVAVFLLISYAKPLTLHPLHLSNTEIIYNEREKQLQITSRIFQDDFEGVIATNYKSKLDLSNPIYKKSADLFISKYFKSHLSFNMGNRILEPSYIGYETANGTVNVYLQVPNVSVFQSINIKNSILHDRFDDQSNFIYIEMADIKKNAKLDYPAREISFKFN